MGWKQLLCTWIPARSSNKLTPLAIFYNFYFFSNERYVIGLAKSFKPNLT